MERDHWIALAVGVVLVGALLGVFLYESRSTPATDLVFPVTWPVTEGGSTQRSDTLDEGEQADFGFQLASANVTRVEVHLSWEDDVGQPDRFNLTVAPPAGAQTVTRSSDNGTLRISYLLSSIPGTSQVQAETEGQARDTMTSRHTTQNGQGDWQVTVLLEEAPGQRPVPQAPELETQPDGSNDFNLTYRYDVYHVRLGEPQVPG